MYRERKNLIEIPEGTLVEILKVRRQTHLCSARCVADENGIYKLGSGRKAEDICIAVPVENLPKMKIEGDETKKKGGKKGTKPATLPVVQPENNQPEVGAGVGPADIQPIPDVNPAVQAAAPEVAPEPAAVETPAPQAEVPAEAAV